MVKDFGVDFRVNPGRFHEGDAADLLTVQEVADRLRVSTATVYRMCDRGELPQVRVSNAIRIPADALAHWLSRTRYAR